MSQSTCSLPCSVTRIRKHTAKVTMPSRHPGLLRAAAGADLGVQTATTTRKRETPDSQKPSGMPEIPSGIGFLTASPTGALGQEKWLLLSVGRQEFFPVGSSCRLSCGCLEDQFLTAKPSGKQLKEQKKIIIHTYMQTCIQYYNFSVPSNPICMVVSYTSPLQFVHTDIS